MNKTLKIIFVILDILLAAGVILLIMQERSLTHSIAEDFSPVIIAGGKKRIATFGIILLLFGLAGLLFRFICECKLSKGLDRTNRILLTISRAVFLGTVLWTLIILVQSFDYVMAAGDVSPIIISQTMKRLLVICPSGICLALIPRIGYWYNKRNYKIPGEWRA